MRVTEYDSRPLRQSLRNGLQALPRLRLQRSALLTSTEHAFAAMLFRENNHEVNSETR
jgi:hypothetical protein